MQWSALLLSYSEGPRVFQEISGNFLLLFFQCTYLYGFRSRFWVGWQFENSLPSHSANRVTTSVIDAQKSLANRDPFALSVDDVRRGDNRKSPRSKGQWSELMPKDYGSDYRSTGRRCFWSFMFTVASLSLSLFLSSSRVSPPSESSLLPLQRREERMRGRRIDAGRKVKEREMRKILSLPFSLREVSPDECVLPRWSYGGDTVTALV